MNQGFNIELPDVLDTVLSYLAETLPSPVYSLMVNLLSHCLALASTLITLLSSLLSKSPVEWDVQTVLPPLISLLAAYLALLSLYRTTTWMIRTFVWFAKWTVIFGALAAGVGWYMGTAQNQAGGIMNGGLVSYFGNMALDIMNGANRNAAGHERTPRSRSAKPPKAWESFDRHRQFQYNEDNARANERNNGENVFDSLMGMAGQVWGSDWRTGVKNVVESLETRSKQTLEDVRTRTQTKKSKSRSKSK